MWCRKKIKALATEITTLLNKLSSNVKDPDQFLSKVKVIVLKTDGAFGANLGAEVSIKDFLEGDVSGKNEKERWSKYLRTELGGTDALNRTEAEARQKYKKYLVNGVTLHAHHIVMRNGIGTMVTIGDHQVDAVEASKDILGRAGIGRSEGSGYNSDYAHENLVWAPNTGHSHDYARATYHYLQSIEPKTNTTISGALKDIGYWFATGQVGAIKKIY